MEKGFRLLCCHACLKTLRIRVTVDMYGKTFDATCTCRAVSRVTIPIPAQSGMEDNEENFEKKNTGIKDIFHIFDIFDDKNKQQ